MAVIVFENNQPRVLGLGYNDHVLLKNIGTNTHAQIDAHIDDEEKHFLMSEIEITESQISDLQNYQLAGNQAKEKTLTQPNELVVLVGSARWYPSQDITINSIRAAVGVPSSGKDIVLNIRKSGVGILDSFLSIEQGSHLSPVVTPSAGSATVSTAEFLTVDIAQIGSVTAGSDLTVTISYT